jgi:CO/xanthine dehydrogenase FAD-binding subunit
MTVPFEYRAPATVQEAVALLAERGGEAKVLAGGQSLVPALTYRLARPACVVDVNRLPLAGLSVADGTLTLGALTRHHSLEESSVVRRLYPILADAAALIGNVRVRSLGTLGGSLAHADPAAELPLVMVALGARVRAEGPLGPRTIEASDFFRGPLTTALTPDELLTEVALPATPAWGAAIGEFARRPGDFALVAVAALVRLDRGGRVEDARLVFGGVAGIPVRSARAEDELRGHEPTAERVAAAARAARQELRPAADPFASAEYRAHLAEVFARRVLAQAASRAMEAR